MLLQLAWMNNPQYEGLQLEEKLNEGKLSWLNCNGQKTSTPLLTLMKLIFPTGEVVRAVNVVFPTLDLSATLNIGSMINRKTNVNIAKYKSDIAVSKPIRQNSFASAITRRYEQYLLALEILKIRAQAVEELYSSFICWPRAIWNLERVNFLN